MSTLGHRCCRGRTRTRDLMPVCRTNPTSGCALPLSYTTHRIYIPSYKQLAATPAYAIRRRAHPHYWTCNQDSVLFVQYVAIMSQPFGLQFPQLPSDLHYYLSALTRKARRFGTYRSRLLSFLWPYFTALFHAVSFLATRDWSLSLPFQLRALHDPLRDYSPPILPLCFQ